MHFSFLVYSDTFNMLYIVDALNINQISLDLYARNGYCEYGIGLDLYTRDGYFEYLYLEGKPPRNKGKGFTQPFSKLHTPFSSYNNFPISPLFKRRFNLKMLSPITQALELQGYSEGAQAKCKSLPNPSLSQSQEVKKAGT